MPSGRRVRRAEGLQVPNAEADEAAGRVECGRQREQKLNAVWSWIRGRSDRERMRFRVLTLLDEYSRRCLWPCTWMVDSGSRRDYGGGSSDGAIRQARPHPQRQWPSSSPTRSETGCKRSARNHLHHAWLTVENAYIESFTTNARRVSEPGALWQPARGAGNPRTVAPGV